MKAPSGSISIKTIRRRGACREESQWAVEKFGEEIPITRENFLRAARNFTIEDIVKYVGGSKWLKKLENEVTEKCPAIEDSLHGCTCHERGKKWVLKNWFGVKK